MVQITLTDEQMRQLNEAEQTVQFVDPRGQLIATLPHGWTQQDVQEATAVAGSKSRRWSTGEVLEHLQVNGREA